MLDHAVRDQVAMPAVVDEVAEEDTLTPVCAFVGGVLCCRSHLNEEVGVVGDLVVSGKDVRWLDWHRCPSHYLDPCLLFLQLVQVARRPVDSGTFAYLIRVTLRIVGSRRV